MKADWWTNTAHYNRERIRRGATVSVIWFLLVRVGSRPPEISDNQYLPRAQKWEEANKHCSYLSPVQHHSGWKGLVITTSMNNKNPLFTHAATKKNSGWYLALKSGGTSRSVGRCKICWFSCMLKDCYFFGWLQTKISSIKAIHF